MDHLATHQRFYRRAPRYVRARRRRRRLGFSLLELIVVVAIIAMISAGITVAMVKHAERSKASLTATNAQTLRSAVKIWWINNDAATCPDVKALLSDGAIDRGKVESDAWGEPWKIECAGHDATIVSKGPDQKLGTEDDIRVPPA